jgi:hypothetical protein
MAEGMMSTTGDAGCTVMARRGVRGLLACAALAIAYALLVALSMQPTPAVAQFGGFGNIHIYFHGGVGRHGHSRRHSRHRQKDKEEPEEAASPSVPSSPSPAGSVSATGPSTVAGPSAPPGPPAAARPEPRGPIFDSPK